MATVVPVDEVIRDRRKKYDETDDAKHLNYEQAFARELRTKGRENPEIRRNYYLEDNRSEADGADSCEVGQPVRKKPYAC